MNKVFRFFFVLGCIFLMAALPINQSQSAQAAPNTNIYNFQLMASEINITGNGIDIVNGDDTPSTADHTDFGSVNVASGTNSRTFTIENLGTADLNLDGMPIVDITGTNVLDFFIQLDPSTPIAENDPTIFTVVFDPSDTGIRTAILTISNDDSDENPYTFYIQGTGFIDTPQVPEINVRGNSVSIANNDGTPSLTDHTDFGSANITSGTTSRIFTIENLGNADLNLGAINITGAASADFSITASPATPVSASGSTTFTVTFDPSTTGTRVAAISIVNDDDNENPYYFSIQGAGTSTTTSKNYIRNGGFNQYPNNINTPTFWQASSFGISDGRDITVKKEGTASVKINGGYRPIIQVTITKTLTQTLEIIGNAGDTFTLSAFIRGTSVPINGTCQVLVTFSNNTLPVTIKSIQCPSGTYAFTLKKITFTVPAAYTRATIRITYSKRQGSIWFDQMKLVK